MLFCFQQLFCTILKTTTIMKNQGIYKLCRRKMDFAKSQNNKAKARIWQKRMICSIQGVHSAINFGV